MAAIQRWGFLPLLPLGFVFRNRFEGLVPELSLDFCATGLDGVQLPEACSRLNPALQEMVQDDLPVGIQVGHFNPMNLGPVVPAPQRHGIVHPLQGQQPHRF